MSADLTSLSDFLDTFDVHAPAEAADLIGMNASDFGDALSVILFDSLCYIVKTQSGEYHAIIGNNDTLHSTLDDAASRLYFDHYVSECVPPSQWTTDSLTNPLHDYSAFYGLPYASADEMLHDILSVDPTDRTYQQNVHIGWLNWFIDLWNDTQNREDEIAVGIRR